jgi:Protein ENHANCED DISEASE RESISTANCE 2, C-terminal
MCKDPPRRCCRVEKGSWIVKQAVGQNTPVLLGKKLTTKYFTGPNYIEVGWRANQIGSCISAVGASYTLWRTVRHLC